MASYISIILDTTAPAGSAILLNDGAIYTGSRNVTLGVSVTDADTTGYTMKVWGIDGVATEADATWETFVVSKSITLPSGDGLKTVYVKVRDDVGNEASSVSASITLDMTVPVVTVTSGPDKTKISKVSGYARSVFAFSVNEPFAEYKVCVVNDATALHDAGTVISTTYGSQNTSGVMTDDPFPADTAITVTIDGADLEIASAGDGTKIIKVFAKDLTGNWSEA